MFCSSFIVEFIFFFSSYFILNCEIGEWPYCEVIRTSLSLRWLPCAQKLVYFQTLSEPLHPRIYFLSFLQNFFNQLTRRITQSCLCISNWLSCQQFLLMTLFYFVYIYSPKYSVLLQNVPATCYYAPIKMRKLRYLSSHCLTNQIHTEFTLQKVMP